MWDYADYKANSLFRNALQTGRIFFLVIVHKKFFESLVILPIDKMKKVWYNLSARARPAQPEFVQFAQKCNFFTAKFRYFAQPIFPIIYSSIGHYAQTKKHKFVQYFFTKPLDKSKIVCYNKVQPKERGKQK